MPTLADRATPGHPDDMSPDEEWALVPWCWLEQIVRTVTRVEKARSRPGARHAPYERNYLKLMKSNALTLLNDYHRTERSRRRCAFRRRGGAV